jgi:ubiquinone/menaquinone biosynthesis C-methylase UbiE
MSGASSAVKGTPSYGVDAPGVVCGFFGAGTMLAIAGLAMLIELTGTFRLLGWPVIIAAVVLLGLGVSMLLYSFVGKRRLRDHLLGCRAWRGDEMVLDIGAGRGLMAVGAARLAPRGRVVAIDVWSGKDLTGNSPAALRANASLERVQDRIEIVTGDARKLDFPDASVDVVASVFCIHNIEPEADRVVTCQEIARVLKPGGVALIADFPGAAPYVDAFREAALTVAGPFRAERIAFGVAGYLVATKPGTAGS